jgi:hypothetical protein
MRTHSEHEVVSSREENSTRSYPKQDSFGNRVIRVPIEGEISVVSLKSERGMTNPKTSRVVEKASGYLHHSSFSGEQEETLFVFLDLTEGTETEEFENLRNIWEAAEKRERLAGVVLLSRHLELSFWSRHQGQGSSLPMEFLLLTILVATLCLQTPQREVCAEVCSWRCTVGRLLKPRGSRTGL